MLTNRRHRQTEQTRRTRWSTAWLALSVIFCGGCDEKITSTYTLPVETESEETSHGDTTALPVNPQNSKPKEQKSPGRIVESTFDDIKFDIEPGDPFEREMLTDEIEALVGKRIRIRGWMLPTFQRKGITKFILVRDNLECCFGPGAALYDCIAVEMRGDATAEFSTQSIAVEGTFSIDEFIGPDGVHLAIYHLSGERVR